MRIFHILLGKANPNTMNGVNKVVDAIATEQQRFGNEVTVCGVARNTVIRHVPKYGYKLFKADRISIMYPRDLLSYLLDNSEEDTVFHFHSVFILWYLPLIKSLKRHGRNHIFLTPHGAYIPEAMNTLKKKIAFQFFDSKILKEVEAVHIIGYQTEDNEYVRKYASKIVVIPNGFGGQIIPPKESPTSNDLIFGYMGRLAKRHKGLDILISAFAEYRRRGGKGLLKLAGGGPDEKFLKQLVKKGTARAVVSFEGVLYNDTKWKFLQGISTLISPSRWDVLPTACLEAAATGCPLVVTAETNMGQYIEKYGAGLLISYPRSDAVVEKLFEFEKAFDDCRAYKKMCDGAKRMIEEELNWKSITRRIIEELYCGK